jgi:hypothetical protein
MGLRKAEQEAHAAWQELANELANDVFLFPELPAGGITADYLREVRDMACTAAEPVARHLAKYDGLPQAWRLDSTALRFKGVHLASLDSHCERLLRVLNGEVVTF